MKTAAIVALLLAGCSFSLAQPPRSRVRPVSCTVSSFAPAADTVGAVAFGLGSVGLAIEFSALANDPATTRDILRYGVPVLVGLVGIVVIYTVAAKSGFNRLARCRALNASPPPPSAPVQP